MFSFMEQPANDNPSRPIPPRALYGYLSPGSDELTFYDEQPQAPVSPETANDA